VPSCRSPFGYLRCSLQFVAFGHLLMKLEIAATIKDIKKRTSGPITKKTKAPIFLKTVLSSFQRTHRQFREKTQTKCTLNHTPSLVMFTQSLMIQRLWLSQVLVSSSYFCPPIFFMLFTAVTLPCPKSVYLSLWVPYPLRFAFLSNLSQ
jgi:hypothetical protein